MGGFFGFIILVIIGLMVISNCIRIVPQSQAYIIERLGSYSDTWETGVHFKIPFIERVAKRVTLKEQVVDFQPFSVITKDNVTMKVDTITFYQVTDPKLFTYGVNDPIRAIELLTNTILRDEFGRMELDQSLTSRDAINSIITEKIDKATDPWGIKVNRVEVKNMIPPKDIQDAMEKQMRAERERREAILKAEGDKKSAILQAEGQKESLLLSAEAKKKADILKAEASKEAAILSAEADAKARLLRAEAEAESIRKVREAEADSFRKLVEVIGKDGVVQLRGFESLDSLAEGKATKVVIPSNIQGLAGTISALKEVADSDIIEESN